MNAAYKQEKKRKAKNGTSVLPPVNFKIKDPLLSAGDSPSTKKLKSQSLYLSFPVDTVLATEPSNSEDIKSELVYHMAETDIH